MFSVLSYLQILSLITIIKIMKIIILMISIDFALNVTVGITDREATGRWSIIEIFLGIYDNKRLTWR